MKIYDIVYSTLSLLFYYTVMYMLLGIKPGIVSKVRLTLSFSFFVLSFIISLYTAGTYGLTTFASYFPLLVLLPVYIVYYMISRFRGAKLFFVFLTTFIFFTPVTLIPFMVGSFVNYSAKIMLISALVTYVILIVVVYQYISPLFLYALENLNHSWILLSSLPIAYIILLYLSDGYIYTVKAWKESSYFRVLLLSIIYISYFVILVLFKQIREHFLLKTEQSILNLQMDSMKTHLSELKNSQIMAAIYRHDLRHHLQYINTCISQSYYEELKHYTKSICNEIENSCIICYCENDSANMILSSYVTKAKGMGADIVIDSVIPASIHITATDLCVILANGIENALHACHDMGGKETNLIYLSCHTKNDKLYIQIKNPYDGVVVFENNIPVTESNGHGLGTKSIVNIVKKYNGLYSFTVKDHIFTLNIII